MNTRTHVDPQHRIISDAIYKEVIKDLALPDPLPEQFGITKDAIYDAYMQCINIGMTSIGAKETILQLWRNSISKR